MWIRDTLKGERCFEATQGGRAQEEMGRRGMMETAVLKAEISAMRAQSKDGWQPPEVDRIMEVSIGSRESEVLLTPWLLAFTIVTKYISTVLSHPACSILLPNS